MKYHKFEGKLTVEAIEDAKALHPNSPEIQAFLKQEAKVLVECCKGLALPSHLLLGGTTSYSNCTTASYKKLSAEEMIEGALRAKRCWVWIDRVSQEAANLDRTDFAGNRRLAELLLILGECQERSLMAVARYHHMRID